MTVTESDLQRFLRTSKIEGTNCQLMLVCGRVLFAMDGQALEALNDRDFVLKDKQRSGGRV